MTEVMLVVSKQWVMRHKLSEDVNMIFSEMSWFIQSFSYKKNSFIYTCHFYINIMISSLLVVVLAGICTCCFLRRDAESVLFKFFFLISQWFVVQDAKRPAGCHHCSLQP